MGNGKKLRFILDEKGKSVRWLAEQTHINPSTLFSIIRKDTLIRYDFALKIADTLNIDINEICSDTSMIEKYSNALNKEEDITYFMSNAKRFEEITREKGIPINKIASETGIPATTLYSIIKRDAKIRPDHAIKIAKFLNISPKEICDDPYLDMIASTINTEEEINSEVDFSRKQIIDELVEDFYDDLPTKDVLREFTELYTKLDPINRQEILDIMRIKIIVAEKYKN